MGGTESKPQSQQFQQHERLGYIRVFQVKDPQEQQPLQKMEVNVKLESKQVLDSWEKEFKKIDDSQSREILLLPQKYQFQKAGVCGSTGVSKLIYNNFSFLLSSQIKNRKHLNRLFLQTEVWYLLYNMIRASHKFQILKKKVGDIHPNNILINQDGQTAIISTISLPGQIDNFQKLIQDKNALVFLAPQQAKQQIIQKGAYPQNLDPCLAEVFSIGMTILSAGTLQTCNQVYTRSPFGVNQNKINLLLRSFSQKYSSYLTNMIASMLAFNPQQRIKSKSLYSTLSPYENQILDLQPFPTQTSQVYGSNLKQNHPYVPQGQVSYNSGYQSGYQGGIQGTSVSQHHQSYQAPVYNGNQIHIPGNRAPSYGR